MKGKINLLGVISSILLLMSNIPYINAETVVNVTLYDAMYEEGYLSFEFSFKDDALGYLGNLTITSLVDFALNVTLEGLEGFIIISVQNRTIDSIPGADIEIIDGTVYFSRTSFVILGPAGGENDSITLLIMGFCIGPYDITPESGRLDVIMPVSVTSVDQKYKTSKDIVDFCNSLIFPPEYSSVDTVSYTHLTLPTTPYV